MGDKGYVVTLFSVNMMKLYLINTLPYAWKYHRVCEGAWLAMATASAHQSLREKGLCLFSWTFALNQQTRHQDTTFVHKETGHGAL